MLGRRLARCISKDVIKVTVESHDPFVIIIADYFDSFYRTMRSEAETTVCAIVERQPKVAQR